MLPSKNNKMANKFRESGNQLYKECKFSNALVKYNASLCSAIPGSVEMAMAYSNRSAVYYDLQQYELCLENIHLALNNDKYPKEKRKKLKDRANRCKKFLEEGKCVRKLEINDFHLTKPPNTKYPSMAKCLELRNNERYGNYLITTENLDPGDVIMKDNFFYHIRETNENMGSVSDLYLACAECYWSNMLNLYPCINCNSTMYCSKECMLKASGYHQYECNHTSVIGLSFECRSFFQALSFCKGNIDELRNLVINSKKLTVFDLDCTKMSPDEINKMSIVIAYHGVKVRSKSDTCRSYKKYLNIINLAGNPKLKEIMKTHGCFVLEFLDRMERSFYDGSFENISQIQIKDNRFSIGAGYCLTYPLIHHHSCAPNVYAYADMKKGIVLIANQPIKAGSQIFICIDCDCYELMTKNERSIMLLNKSIECYCKACIENYPVIAENRSEIDNSVRLLASKIKTAPTISIDQLEKYFEILKYMYSVCKSNPDLEPNIVTMRLFVHLAVKKFLANFSET